MQREAAEALARGGAGREQAARVELGVGEGIAALAVEEHARAFRRRRTQRRALALDAAQQVGFAFRAAHAQRAALQSGVEVTAQRDRVRAAPSARQLGLAQVPARAGQPAALERGEEVAAAPRDHLCAPLGRRVLALEREVAPALGGLEVLGAEAARQRERGEQTAREPRRCSGTHGTGATIPSRYQTDGTSRQRLAPKQRDQ